MPPLTIASPLKMAMRSNAKAKNRSHPWHIPKFVKRSYPVGNRTLSPKLFLKTLVSLVNSPILVVILPLNSIDPEAPCLA